MTDDNSVDAILERMARGRALMLSLATDTLDDPVSVGNRARQLVEDEPPDAVAGALIGAVALITALVAGAGCDLRDPAALAEVLAMFDATDEATRRILDGMQDDNP